MKIPKSVTGYCFTALVAGTCLVIAGDPAPEAQKNSSQPPAATSAADLLKGIVHFTDNDIRFRTAAGTVVFVDPVNGPADKLVARTGMLKPDLILITHSHADHFQPAVLQQYLKLNPDAVIAGPPDVARLASGKGLTVTEIKPRRNYSLAGIDFSTVPACFLEGDSHPKAKGWVGYVLQLNGARYYVTGDTQPLAEMAGVKADVIFPLLYGCGGNMEQAEKMTALSQARVAVPVHTSNQEEVIKKYLAGLPKGVQGAYYRKAELISGPTGSHE